MVVIKFLSYIHIALICPFSSITFLVLILIFKVHRLDRESSGLLLMGRSKESISLLNWLFSDLNKGKSSCKVLISVLQPSCLNEIVLDDFSCLKLYNILN